MNAPTNIQNARTRLTVIEGEAHVSADPACEMTTILGSCVSACLYDPIHRIGGMNHFLLGEPAPGSNHAVVDEHYGLYLMELLVNRLMQKGADRKLLRAHLYGGARLRDGLGDIGASNARFATGFLRNERIPLVRSDLGGSCARRIGFRPFTGQIKLTQIDEKKVPTPKPHRRPIEGGDIEFF